MKSLPAEMIATCPRRLMPIALPGPRSVTIAFAIMIARPSAEPTTAPESLMPVTVPCRPRPRAAPDCQTVISPSMVPAIVSLSLTANAQLDAPAGAGKSARLPFAKTNATLWLPLTVRHPTTVPFVLMAKARPNPSGVMSTTTHSVAIAWAAKLAQAASTAAIPLNPLPISPRSIESSLRVYEAALWSSPRSRLVPLDHARAFGPLGDDHVMEGARRFVALVGAQPRATFPRVGAPVIGGPGGVDEVRELGELDHEVPVLVAADAFVETRALLHERAMEEDRADLHVVADEQVLAIELRADDHPRAAVG